MRFPALGCSRCKHLLSCRPLKLLGDPFPSLTSFLCLRHSSTHDQTPLWEKFPTTIGTPQVLRNTMLTKADETAFLILAEIAISAAITDWAGHRSAHGLKKRYLTTAATVAKRNTTMIRAAPTLKMYLASNVGVILHLPLLRVSLFLKSLLSLAIWAVHCVSGRMPYTTLSTSSSALAPVQCQFYFMDSVSDAQPCSFQSFAHHRSSRA